MSLVLGEKSLNVILLKQFSLVQVSFNAHGPLQTIVTVGRHHTQPSLGLFINYIMPFQRNYDPVTPLCPMPWRKTSSNPPP